MAQAPERTAPMFVPRTIASFERATSRFVARFERPVRALGARALGFSDRILRNRLGSLRLMAPRTVKQQGTSFQFSGIASAPMLMVEPWYIQENQHLTGRVAWKNAPAGLATAKHEALPANALSEELEDRYKSSDGSTGSAERGASIQRQVLELDSPVQSGDLEGASSLPAEAGVENSASESPVAPASLASTQTEQITPSKEAEIAVAAASTKQENEGPVAKSQANSSIYSDVRPSVQRAESQRAQGVSHTEPEQRAVEFVDRLGAGAGFQTAGLPPALMTLTTLVPDVMPQMSRGMAHVDWADARLERLAMTAEAHPASGGTQYVFVQGSPDVAQVRSRGIDAPMMQRSSTSAVTSSTQELRGADGSPRTIVAPTMTVVAPSSEDRLPATETAEALQSPALRETVQAGRQQKVTAERPVSLVQSGSYVEVPSLASPAAPGYQGQSSFAHQVMGNLVVPASWSGDMAHAQMLSSASLPNVRFAPSLELTAQQHTGSLNFVEHLAGNRASLDSRMLPIDRPAPPMVQLMALGRPTLSPAVNAPSPIEKRERGVDFTMVQPLTQSVTPAAAATKGYENSIITTPFMSSVAGVGAIDSTVQRLAMPEIGKLHRPGGLGSLAEQVAGRIGIRAAGLSIDFMEPEQAWTYAGLLQAQQMLSYVSVGAQDQTKSPDVSGSTIAPLRSVPSETPEAPASPERLNAAWSLMRVFPAAAPSIIASLANDNREMPAPGHAAPHFSQKENLPPAIGQQAFTTEPNARAAAAVGLASTFVAPTSSRPILPDGHTARGSFTWTRAAEFAQQFGEWVPPATVTAANEGGASAAAGHPAWGGMEPIEVPSINAAFGESATKASLLNLVPGDAKRAVLGAAGQAQMFSQVGSVAPLLRSLIAGTEKSTAGSSPSNNSTTSWSPPAQMALVQPPTSTPKGVPSETTASIVEALKSQRSPQRLASDDRITLSDMALVATASSSQQVAAAAAESHGGGAKAQPQAAKAEPGKQGKSKEKSPEQEQAEVEALARRVLNELSTVLEISQERSGATWEK